MLVQLHDTLFMCICGQDLCLAEVASKLDAYLHYTTLIDKDSTRRYVYIYVGILADTLPSIRKKVGAMYNRFSVVREEKRGACAPRG